MAGDASLEAWAIVVRKAGKSAEDFPEDFGIGPSEIVTSIMQPGPWRSVKPQRVPLQARRYLARRADCFSTEFCSSSWHNRKSSETFEKKGV